MEEVVAQAGSMPCRARQTVRGGASEPSDARRIPGRTPERFEILEGWVFRWWGRWVSQIKSRDSPPCSLLAPSCSICYSSNQRIRRNYPSPLRPHPSVKFLLVSPTVTALSTTSYPLPTTSYPLPVTPKHPHSTHECAIVVLKEPEDNPLNTVVRPPEKIPPPANT